MGALGPQKTSVCKNKLMKSLQVFVLVQLPYKGSLVAIHRDEPNLKG
jgi:hypothetical protein